MLRLAATTLAPVLLIASAASQNVHIDIGDQAGTPSTVYRGADPAAPGSLYPTIWNTVPADATGVPLVAADGTPTGITITIVGGTAYSFDHPGTNGDDAALLDDGSQSAGTQTITLAGLPSTPCGFDLAYTLGSDPAQTTRVRYLRSLFVGPPVLIHELDATGAWPGKHEDGTSYVVHVGETNCDAVYDGDLVIEVEPAPGSTQATITGLQFTYSAGFPFCDDMDNSLASCPCAPGSPLTGCDSPIPAMQGGGTTGGIRLSVVRQETFPQNRVTMTSFGFPAASSPGVVIFRGSSFSPGPSAFGDGVLCTAGTIVRVSGAIATNGASLHTFGHGSMWGTGFFPYQAWFRSTPASYCDAGAAFNLSNGQALGW